MIKTIKHVENNINIVCFFPIHEGHISKRTGRRHSILITQTGNYPNTIIQAKKMDAQEQQRPMAS